MSFRLNLKCNFSAWRSVNRFSSISVSVNINFYSRLIWSSYGTSTEMPNYFLPSLIRPNIWYISKKYDFIRSNVKTLQFQALGCSLFSLFLHLLVARDEMIDQRHMIHNLWIIIMSHDRNIIYDCTNIRIPWQCNKLIFEIIFYSRFFELFWGFCMCSSFACSGRPTFWSKIFTSTISEKKINVIVVSSIRQYYHSGNFSSKIVI